MNSYKNHGFSVRLSTPANPLGETFPSATLAAAVAEAYALARGFDLAGVPGSIDISEYTLEIADGKPVTNITTILLSCGTGPGVTLLRAFHAAVQAMAVTA